MSDVLDWLRAEETRLRETWAHRPDDSNAFKTIKIEQLYKADRLKEAIEEIVRLRSV